MKFHEYRTLWQEMRGKLPGHVTEQTFYAVSMASGARAGNGLVLAEGAWKQLRRPYYQVWPAIVPALLNLRLDIDAGLIHTPMRALTERLISNWSPRPTLTQSLGRSRPMLGNSTASSTR